MNTKIRKQIKTPPVAPLYPFPTQLQQDVDVFRVFKITVEADDVLVTQTPVNGYLLGHLNNKC